jgi:prepilin-type processing-associated H-X9-DG protein
MGLGKTIQAIAAMAALYAEGKTHFMVVCPASVLINWCREIEKHSALPVTKVHGKDEDALLHWRENGGVAVTTYESISRFSLPLRFRHNRTINVLFIGGQVSNKRYEEVPGEWRVSQPNTYIFFDEQWGYK